MQRTHLSRSRITTLQSPYPRPHSVAVVRDGIKPEGFWYEINGAWRDWMASEQPDWFTEVRYQYELDTSQCNLLTLSTVAEVVAFQKQWRSSHDIVSLQHPRWHDLQASYDGIEINPYQRSLRLRHGFIWYYGWDCASGCIWDTSRVKILSETVLEDHDTTPTEPLLGDEVRKWILNRFHQLSTRQA